MSNSDDSILKNETVQGFLFHLGELKKRLSWTVLGVLVATLGSFFFAQDILQFLIEPYGVELQTLRPTEGIETYFKIALLTGAIISMPWTLIQIWIFVAEGLERKEKRSIYVFVPSATILFLIGVYFSWKVLVPSAVTFLSTFLADVFVAEWTSQEYIGFVTGFIFMVGVSFEMPLFFYTLARIGLVTSKGLRSQWRLSIVGIAVAAAVITPSIDPVTMLLTMLPLLVLYVLSIFLAILGERHFARLGES